METKTGNYGVPLLRQNTCGSDKTPEEVQLPLQLLGMLSC